MPVTNRNLGAISPSGLRPTVFAYETTDSKATVKGAGYFNLAASMLAVGDRILIHCSDADFDAHVSANTGTVVTIAAVDAFA